MSAKKEKNGTFQPATAVSIDGGSATSEAFPPGYPEDNHRTEQSRDEPEDGHGGQEHQYDVRWVYIDGSCARPRAS